MSSSTRDLDEQENKVAIVTGSNQGLGYGIVKVLCEKFDGDVYLTAPTEKQGLDAIKSLNELGYHPKFHVLDITVPEHAEKLRDHIVKHYGGLDILVNNAGIAEAYVAHIESAELRARKILEVNYFGFRDTCNTLFPILRPHARVVNITSTSSVLLIPGENIQKMFASPDLTEQQLSSLVTDYIEAVKNGTFKEDGWPNSSYQVSKVAISALSRIQQRELLKDKNRPDIIVNYVYPGPVDTFLEAYASHRKLTIEQGAETPVSLALLPENCQKPKGDFVWYPKEIVDWVNGPLPPYLLDEIESKRPWFGAEELKQFIN